MGTPRAQDSLTPNAIASLKAGLLPIWGTEICDRKRRAWVDLTDTPDMGDTFTTDFKEMPTPDVLWTGQTCVDYSLSGPKTGSEGDTGWMFVAQSKPIMELQPNVVIIEMVANALKVNDGAEVEAVKAALSTKYEIHQKVIRVRDYGVRRYCQSRVFCL